MFITYNNQNTNQINSINQIFKQLNIKTDNETVDIKCPGSDSESNSNSSSSPKEINQGSFFPKYQTDVEQNKVEKEIKEIYKENNFSTYQIEKYSCSRALYYKRSHFQYAKNLMYSLPSSCYAVDSGMSWFSYWVLNIIEMTKDGNKFNLSYSEKLKFIPFLKELYNSDGGFSGLPKGNSHIISTYAAIMSIVNLGIKEAYEIIDVNKMKNFLVSLKHNNHKNSISNDKNKKQSSYKDKNNIFLINRDIENNISTYNEAFPGAFSSHYNGESDLRSTYCALIVAYILNIIDPNDQNFDVEKNEITSGVVNNIKNCQSYEGGFSPQPYCEAHGGYTYCGLASLILLKQLNKINIKNLVRWLVNRQMTLEGGFNGRTNKLVDSCYSFWVGGCFNLLAMGDNNLSYDLELMYDQLALQSYILYCCQDSKGGLKDKPGKNTDLFHTNYATSGFSLSQKCFIDGGDDAFKVCINYDKNNEINEINPIFCANNDKVLKAKKYFSEIYN